MSRACPRTAAYLKNTKKLKRRFFELEEETSTELQRSSERNVRMREERNMLLDRIIELEAQSQQQNQPSLASAEFPRTLLNARARTSFIENLRQAVAEDDSDEDAELASTSRHVLPPTRKKAGEDSREDNPSEDQKSPSWRSRSLYTPTSSPKGKEVDDTMAQQFTAVLPPRSSLKQRPGSPDIVNTDRDRELPKLRSPVNPRSLSPLLQSPIHLVQPVQTEMERTSPTPKSFASPHSTSYIDKQNGRRSPEMTSSNDGSAATDPGIVGSTSHAASGIVDAMDVDNELEQGPSMRVTGRESPHRTETSPHRNDQAVTATHDKEVCRGAGRSPRAKRTRKGGAAERPESSRRTSARLARNTVPRMVSPPCAPATQTSPPISPPASGTVTEVSSPTVLDVIDPLLKTCVPANPPSSQADPTPTSQAAASPASPTPSIDSIDKVAAAAVAAQNAARSVGSTSRNSDNSTLDPTDTASSPAASQAQGAKPPVDAVSPPAPAPSPSSVGVNPYLALSAVKPAGGSPVGMHPMMAPMNPYSMYYAVPGAPGAPPYPYANPYYYMSPMAGPSTLYPPPNGNGVSLSPNAPRSPSDIQRAAKPKRLKAHTVTSKQFSIPVVPRDRSGKPMLPLNVGIMTVINLGTVCMREHFHTERYIFPVGYEVTRRYMSTIDPNHEVVYHCTILDGGDGPKFQIIPADCPERPVIAGTATGAWSTIVKQANAIRNRQHSNSVSGPDFFGLGQNTIKHLIQQLPNADKLRDYVWQHFLEGGPLGGRHAAVIPALPDEYENILPLSALQQQDKQKNSSPPDPTRGLSYYPQHIIQQAQQQQRPNQQVQQQP